MRNLCRIQMKLDENSIITALLHDVIEDTLATKEEIKKIFGIEIANLVDGVTKLSKINLQQTNKNKQVENLRKFILAISEDIRVLFVKLADRLHNMRTIKFLKDSNKKKKISNETLEIFAPLADRIGIRKIKDELEITVVQWSSGWAGIPPPLRNKLWEWGGGGGPGRPERP